MLDVIFEGLWFISSNNQNYNQKRIKMLPNTATSHKYAGNQNYSTACTRSAKKYVQACTAMENMKDL